jgi:hypothetical protein
MRSGQRGSGRLKRIAAPVAVVGAVTLVAAPLLGAASVDDRSTANAVPMRVVHYGQVSVTVPASWPVYDLSKDPRRCIRFDQHAVYLGRPGARQDCPARAVGRSAAVLIEPYQPGFGPYSASLSDPTAGTVVRALPAARALVTGEYGDDGDARVATDAVNSATVRSTAAQDRAALYMSAQTPLPDPVGPVRLTDPARSAPWPTSPATTPMPTPYPVPTPVVPTPTPKPTPVPTPTPTPNPVPTPKPTPTPTPTPDPPRKHKPKPKPKPKPIPRRVYVGTGFDTCTAPAVSDLRDWLSSRYRAVGIYIGGINRACGDGNLSAPWVSDVNRMGWRLIPIYVGLQAPCVMQGGLAQIDGGHGEAQGDAAAADAAGDAARFGLARGSTIYFDMEGYGDDGGCRAAVHAFLDGWTRGLHAHGYYSAVYSSADSGIHDLSTSYGDTSFARPDAIWTARWDNWADVWDDPAVPNSEWGHHQRLKQFAGGHDESFGGTTINIDSDVLDGPVAVVH